MRPDGDRSRIDAEAAAWLARLKGPHRTAETEAALQDWLRVDAAHADAFERATELWDLLPGLAASERHESSHRATRRYAPYAIAASLLTMIGAGAMYQYLGQGSVLETRIGEQRTATLDDGSRVSLNTDSHVTVRFARAERTISLDQGEAQFDVAHDAARPFVVHAGDETIRALGTNFVVRRDGDEVRVTLLRGKVEVRRDGDNSGLLAVLRPGERLSASPGGTPVLDRPAVEAVTAWRRGEILFDGTPLGQAIAEVNRYGRVRLIVEDPRVAALPVSGVFTTDDVAEFADAIAQLHGLRVRRRADNLLITS